MAFNWFVSWISTFFSYANPEDKKQGRKQKRKSKIPISKECNGPCDSAQDNGTLADSFRPTCQRFQYNWDNGKIGTGFKIRILGKEFNLLLAVCLHNFGDNDGKQAYDFKKEDKGPCDLVQDTFAHKAEKQGHDFNKEDKGSSNLCQEIFAQETENQDHELIKEGESTHDLSQEKIDILKDWELTESKYSSDFSYVPKEKDRESLDSSEDTRKLSESTCSSESSYVFIEKDLETTYSIEDSRKCSESTDSNSSYVSKEKDCERPDSSEVSMKLPENDTSCWYRKPKWTPSSDVVNSARKKKNKKRHDSGQSESSKKGSPSSDLKQDTSVDQPSKTYAKSVLKNLKPLNDPEKKEGHPYNQDFEDFKKTPNFRPVFMDGCNIGYEYGKKRFSAKGLLIAYNYFKDLGYKDDQIIIIQRNIPERILTREDLDIMDNLRDLKVLTDVLSFIDKDSRLDDDLLIIKLAWKNSGIGKKN